jgi:hypothetical protein
MLSQLSYWPWIIGTVVSFLVVVITTKRTVGETYISPSVALLGSGAIAVILCGLIEASTTGVFVGRSVGDVLDAMLGLGLTSLISSFAALFPSYPVLKKLGKVS